MGFGAGSCGISICSNVPSLQFNKVNIAFQAICLKKIFLHIVLMLANIERQEHLSNYSDDSAQIILKQMEKVK